MQLGISGEWYGNSSCKDANLSEEKEMLDNNTIECLRAMKMNAFATELEHQL